MIEMTGSCMSWFRGMVIKQYLGIRARSAIESTSFICGNFFILTP